MWSSIVSIPDVCLLPYFHIEGKYVFITLKTRNYKTGNIASSEDHDEMPHDAAFHQGLRCLLRRKRFIRERNTFLRV